MKCCSILLTALLLLSAVAMASDAVEMEVRLDATLVHTAPSYVSEVTGQLSRGDRVRILERRGKWLRAEQGWIHEAFLEQGSGEVSENQARETVAGSGGPDCSQKVEEVRRRMRAECERRQPSKKDAKPAREGATGQKALRARILELESERDALRSELDRTRKAQRGAAEDRSGELEEVRETAYEEGRKAGMAQDSSGRNKALDRCEAELKSAKEDAFEEGKAAGRDEARQAHESQLAEIEADWKRQLVTEANRIFEGHQEEIKQIRERERIRVQKYLDEIERLQQRQRVTDRERVETHVETMCDAKLREQQLRLDREKDNSLERERQRLERKHSSALLRATATAEKAFDDRLALLLEQERENCESSLEMVRNSTQAVGEREQISDISRLVRKEQEELCEQQKAELRDKWELDLEKTVQRRVRTECRKKQRGPEEGRADREPAQKSQEGAGGKDCRREVQRALETARSDWQRETASLVQRAVEEEKSRCGSGG